MTKRIIKKNLTKRKKCNKITKKQYKKKYTKKIKYGGFSAEEQIKKTNFRIALNNYVNQIIKSTSRNKIKDGITSIINLFKDNIMINTLIPVSSDGKYVAKGMYVKEESKESVVDYVSPIIFILDNLTGVTLLTDKDIIRILNAYYLNSGNFNNLSSRFKISPFKNELNKQRINNVKILLDKSNGFHIYEEGLDEETKTKLSELIPNEQKIITEPESTPIPETMPIHESTPIPETMPIHESTPIPESASLLELIPEKELLKTNIKLQLPYPLPDNNEIGYDKTIVPEFWKPIFQNGDKLLEIRDGFMGIYELDRYTDDKQKRIKICEILETIVPGYFTRTNLDFRETAKTLINLNILNCFITLFYGMILYRLYDTKQDYLIIFKGGRALQLSLVGIDDVGKYFSEDTDILIIPNKFEGSNYDLSKMENLSEHIAYLIKWMIPEEINVLVSLPTNPKNNNKYITKLLYNDGRLFKALSDIGFEEINEDIRKYFDNLSYSPIYINSFDTTSLFITPTLDDMLSEKLFYYTKYFKIKKTLEKNEPIKESKYTNLTKEDCDYLLYKFKRSIFKLVEAITKRDYKEVVDFNKTDTSRLILRGFIGNFDDYTNQEKEETIISIFP